MPLPAGGWSLGREVSNPKNDISVNGDGRDVEGCAKDEGEGIGQVGSQVRVCPTSNLRSQTIKGSGRYEHDLAPGKRQEGKCPSTEEDAPLKLNWRKVSTWRV